MKNMNSTVDLDAQYQDKIKDISFQPVFIMGLQRSGTSILYKMLDATNCFNVVTAYHIIKYNELLHNHINNLDDGAKNALSEFFGHHSKTTRGIDNLQITPDFPEEYGFLLAQKTRQSKLNQNNMSSFMELCKKIQFISESEKLLLLKNPFDFSNFMYIKKYNQAFDNKILLHYYRFIYSSYIPYRAISAVRKMTKETNNFLENIDYLQKDEEYINVRYEDLCKDPQSTITSIMKFLDLPFQPNLEYRDFIKPRRTVLLKELQKREQFIAKRMNKYLSYCGYTTEKPSQN